VCVCDLQVHWLFQSIHKNVKSSCTLLAVEEAHVFLGVELLDAADCLQWFRH